MQALTLREELSAPLGLSEHGAAFADAMRDILNADALNGASSINVKERTVTIAVSGSVMLHTFRRFYRRSAATY
jgi:hypothetical protein